ncbi:unnamed protein product [Boreogadus saida]
MVSSGTEEIIDLKASRSPGSERPQTEISASRSVVQMENYRKASTEEDPARCPFLHLPAGTPQVRVKDGSKIRNIVGFALSHVEAPRPRPLRKGDRPPEGGATAEAPEVPEIPVDPKPLSRQIVFTATGKGISKAITCAEMVKRRLRGGGGMHQRTELQYRAVRELWEPLEPGAGLDALTVSRNVPALWILLSRDPLEPPGPADQPPGALGGLWAQAQAEGEGEGEEEEGEGEGGRGGGGGGRAGARKKRGGYGERGGGRGGRGRGGRGRGGRPPGRPRGPGRGQSHIVFK